MTDTMPPEPVPGTMMAPDQFPGAGFEVGDEVDGDAMNAYAERVGWACRFAEVTPGVWQIGYPTTPTELEKMRAQSAASATLRRLLTKALPPTT